MTNIYKTLEATAANVLTLLQREGTRILTPNAVNSPRAVGDTVQEFLASEQGLSTCFPEWFTADFESGFARRSMEDMAFQSGTHYFAVDCKTHNLNTDFNMPNLISVRRLANFYANDTNTFCLLIVEYTVENGLIEYRNCYFKPIEALDWDCLTFGALGWGQIQIANANILHFINNIDRKAWMIELCDRIDAFYCEEIGKIGTRRQWFDNIRQYWINK